jgi:hypothetical protein
MNEDRARALALRQGQLLERSATLRAQLARDAQPWQQTLGRVDEARTRAQAGWQWLRAHPEVPAAALALLLVLRPRRTAALAWRWGRRAWLGWQLWRRLGAAPPAPGPAWLAGLQARPGAPRGASPLQTLLQQGLATLLPALLQALMQRFTRRR